MKELSRWVLQLCCGGIVYGILENLLPDRGTFSVIKTAAILYIILILLSPARELRLPELALPELSVPRTEAAQQDTESVSRAAAAVLRSSLEQALAADGTGVRLQDVRLEYGGDGIASVRLILQMPPDMAEADKIQIQRRCDGLLGMEGAYEWREG